MAKQQRRRTFPHELAPEPERDVAQPARDRDYGNRVSDELRGRIAPSADDARAFAERLVELLKLSGVTVDDVASHLKFSVRQVKQWTTAQTPTIPDAALLLALCRRYRFSATYLLLGAGPPFLDQLAPSADLGEWLSETVADRLRARDHDEESIGAILAHDRDVLARLVATYDARLRLGPIARVLGLSPELMEFATREIDVRLVVGRTPRRGKTATRIAAEKHTVQRQAQSSRRQSPAEAERPGRQRGRGSSKRGH
jgi:transcriptional regulator with XRE-family HTH domain